MKTIDANDLAQLTDQARAVPRRRMNLNLHPELSDPIQRLLNALEPGTYVRPHRHNEGVWEMFVLLKGRALVLVFDAEGTVTERVELTQGGTILAEFGPGQWHAVLGLEPGTVVFETKPGPYQAATDKNFAPWAPKEGEEGAAELVAWMENAQVGAVAPRG